MAQERAKHETELKQLEKDKVMAETDLRAKVDLERSEERAKHETELKTQATLLK